MKTKQELQSHLAELQQMHAQILTAAKAPGNPASHAAGLLRSKEFKDLESRMSEVTAELNEIKNRERQAEIEAARAAAQSALKDPESTLKKLQAALKKAQSAVEKATATHKKMEAHLALARESEVKAAEALDKRNAEEMQALLSGKDLPEGPDLILAQQHAQRAVKVAGAAVQQSKKDKDSADAHRRDAERELRMHQHLMDNINRQQWAEAALKTWTDHGGKDAQALIQTLKTVHGVA